MHPPRHLGLLCSWLQVGLWEGDRGTTEMYFEAEFNGGDESLTQRDWDNAYLVNDALDIHADALPARGILAGENRWPDCALKNASGRSSPRSAD
ncbi:MAG: hypothetical protein QOD59_4442 [Mycobacterium sp.]|nr:hypothetical protein [Mycobacterium sp.]